MIVEFRDLVAKWINEDVFAEEKLAEVNSHINYLDGHLFDEYIPTSGVEHSRFQLRLAKWVMAADTEHDRKQLFKLASKVFFIGEKEMAALYYTAFSKHILCWLASVAGIDLLASDAEQRLQAVLRDTLFTAVTDSLDIGRFLRLNNIQADPRYIWKQGASVWEPGQFERDYLKGKKYVVLLEDFVGSGDQMLESVIKCLSLPSQPSVLLCPLIICWLGDKHAREIAQAQPHMTYSPVLTIDKESCLTEVAQADEPAIFTEARPVITRLHPKLQGSANDWSQDYGPHGFPGSQTHRLFGSLTGIGGLAVKYDNCPDNTLPILHRKSDLWEPLFFRQSRLPE